MCKLLTYTLVTCYYMKCVIKEFICLKAYTYSLNSPCMHSVENARDYMFTPAASFYPEVLYGGARLDAATANRPQAACLGP